MSLRLLGRAAAKAKAPAKPKAVGDKKAASGGSKALGGAPSSGAKGAKAAGSAADKLNELYLNCLEPPPRHMYGVRDGCFGDCTLIPCILHVVFCWCDAGKRPPC